MALTLSAVSFSLSGRPYSREEWLEAALKELKEALGRGADIIVFPELFLLGLTAYYQGSERERMIALAQDMEAGILPRFTRELSGREVLLCLGSGPRFAEGLLYNAAPIYVNGQWHFQEKIHLTPWETDFTPGRSVFVYDFRAYKVACLICFDIEQPSLATLLKQEGVDIVLVPSATADRNGNQRVIRSASARSVELGAVVVTVPVVGKSSCDLVDFSEGRQALFWPAQSCVTVEQEQYSAYSADETVVQDYQLDETMLQAMKVRDNETKPYFKAESKVPLQRVGKN